MTEQTEVNVWIGCLAAYTSGRLHGQWIEVTPDVETLEEEIQEVLKTSPMPNAEEYFVADYESPIPIGEYESLDNVCLISEIVNELEGHVAEKLECFSDLGFCIPEIAEKIRQGIVPIVNEKHELIAEWLGEDPVVDHIYFDWDAAWRDYQVEHVLNPVNSENGEWYASLESNC